MSISLKNPENHLNWVEISKKALINNIKVIRRKIGPGILLAPCVKANAYGHGLIEISKLAISGGADWLCVNALFEAKILRQAGIKSPIYIMGYVPGNDLKEAIRLNCRLIVYNRETVVRLAKEAGPLRKKAIIHIKIETGNNRQGVLINDLLDFVGFTKKFPQIEIEGMATHFANIEDINPQSPLRKFPVQQLENFKSAIRLLEKNGIRIPIRHCANSAATILYPETYFEMVRPGIAVYGLWPSEEVKISAQKKHAFLKLQPVLSWKTRIAQIKEVPAGGYIGYGCTYRAKAKMKLAILPIGYYDGYDRRFSNKSHVLIRGEPAAVRGRVCMNIIMADVTKIPRAAVEDEVTLIGKDGKREITADYLAELIGSINYELTTRIRESIPHVLVD